MDLQCRMMKPEDAEMFRSVRLEALKEAPLDFESSYDAEAQMLLPELKRLMGQHAIVGGFLGGQLKGFAIIDAVRLPRLAHRARVSSVFVTRDVRGTGAAESMMKWMLKEFSRYFSLYRIGVREDNERAIAFFKKMGFEPMGVEPQAMFLGMKDGEPQYVNELQMACVRQRKMQKPANVEAQANDG